MDIIIDRILETAYKNNNIYFNCICMDDNYDNSERHGYVKLPNFMSKDEIKEDDIIINKLVDDEKYNPLILGTKEKWESVIDEFNKDVCKTN